MRSSGFPELVVAPRDLGRGVEGPLLGTETASSITPCENPVVGGIDRKTREETNFAKVTVDGEDFVEERMVLRRGSIKAVRDMVGGTGEVGERGFGIDVDLMLCGFRRDWVVAKGRRVVEVCCFEVGKKAEMIVESGRMKEALDARTGSRIL